MEEPLISSLELFHVWMWTLRPRWPPSVLNATQQRLGFLSPLTHVQLFNFLLHYEEESFNNRTRLKEWKDASDELETESSHAFLADFKLCIITMRKRWLTKKNITVIYSLWELN